MNTNDENLTENEYDAARDAAHDDAAHDDAAHDVDESVMRSGTDDFFGGGLDIDAALAALETLPDVIAEREAEEAAERARLAALKADEEERKEAERIAAEEYALWLESYHLPSPPSVKMQRGKIQSIVPAVLLMASGAYLTFALTFSDAPPAPSLVMLILCGVPGVSLLAYWLASERWARGALFAALALILGGGTLYYTLQPEVTWEWEPLLIALGLSGLLAGLLARPFNGRLMSVGLAVMAAGGFMFMVAEGLLDAALLQTLTPIAPFILIAFVVLMLVPLVFRRGIRA